MSSVGLAQAIGWEGYLSKNEPSGLLFIGLLLNWVFNPTRAVLERVDLTEYARGEPA